MTQEHKDLPAPIPKPGSSDTSMRSAKGILCPKCSHVNRPGSTKCSRCEAHLHIKCNDCGATNERAHSRCRECGRRLHKGALEKINRRLFQNSRKVSPWQVILIIVVVAAIFGLVVAFNEINITPRR